MGSLRATGKSVNSIESLCPPLNSMGERRVGVQPGTTRGGCPGSPIPTFCLYITPVFAQGRYRIRGYQKPIELSGQVEEKVTLYPGDFVLADRDGVVIVPAALAEEVLFAAERLEQIEEQLRKALLAGEDREEV